MFIVYLIFAPQRNLNQTGCAVICCVSMCNHVLIIPMETPMPIEGSSEVCNCIVNTVSDVSIHVSPLTYIYLLTMCGNYTNKCVPTLLHDITPVSMSHVMLNC